MLCRPSLPRALVAISLPTQVRTDLCIHVFPLQGELTITSVRSWNRLPMEHGINITTIDKGTYYFLAPSSAAKAEWVRSINAGIEVALKSLGGPRTAAGAAGGTGAGAAAGGAAAGAGAGGASAAAATPLLRAASTGALPELGAWVVEGRMGMVLFAAPPPPMCAARHFVGSVL